MNLEEKLYIKKRIYKAKLESALFYFFRLFPIKKNKVVFCCIEGTTGFSCNPKYIANECIRRNQEELTNFELVWLVNDLTKSFPAQIKVVKNNLINRAYHLSTAGIWIDNSRKQLEVRKRHGQKYIQTWHAKLGFKPTCLDRGRSFSRIAYLVSKHDSDMVDYWLSNSQWYNKTLATGALYYGKTILSGSPRCDILVNQSPRNRQIVRERYNLPASCKIMMYAPTFRGGSQSTNRTLEHGSRNHMPDFSRCINALENRFDGEWFIFLRLHPQLTARNLLEQIDGQRIVDVSTVDDMYELLCGCDAFMTDYSSAAFDAAIMKIPVFLYCDDLDEYEAERGKLLWDLKKLPFAFASDNGRLETVIECFSMEKYSANLKELWNNTELMEEGNASQKVVDLMERIVKE